MSAGRLWSGRVISGLSAAVFLMSASMKLQREPEFMKGMAHLGLPESMIMPLAILEIACVLVYLMPATAVTGAVLLTGYLGGAILTHWRVGDPVVVPVVLGLLVWLGLYLREVRLSPLMPVRRAPLV